MSDNLKGSVCKKGMVTGGMGRDAVFVCMTCQEHGEHDDDRHREGSMNTMYRCRGNAFGMLVTDLPTDE